MSSKLLLLYIFVILLQITWTKYPLGKGDQNTCLDRYSGQYKCCGSFEEVNGTCVDCPIGKQSKFGQPCVPCEYNRFGYKCIEDCKCDSSQKCDNVHGCVNKTFSTETAYYYSTDGTIISTTEVHQTTAKSSVVGITDVTSYGTEENSPDPFENGTFSKSNLLIYSGSVTGIIILLGFGYLINRCRTRAKIRKTRNETQISEINIPDVQSEEGGGTNEVYEGVYHTIDESKIATLSKTRNSYLEIIDGVPSPKSDGSKNASPYLDPVEYETSSDSHESDDDENYNKIDEDALSYIHPYRSLETSTEDSHPYEKGCPQHTVEVKIERYEKYENSQSFEYCDACTIPIDSKSEQTTSLPETNSVQIKSFGNQSMEGDKLSDS